MRGKIKMMLRLAVVVFMAICMSFPMTVLADELPQLETPVVSWDKDHPGKVIWNEVKSATGYEVIMYRITNSGNPKKVYNTTTKTTVYEVDLCKQLAKDSNFGEAIYVEVKAKANKKNNRDSEYGDTGYFHDAEIEWRPTEYHRTNRHGRHYYEVDVDDNWSLFRAAYWELHDEFIGEESDNDNNDWDDRERPNDSKRNGWVQRGSDWYYYKNGERQTGWIGDFYCDENGAMARGWRKISNKWYYFSESGTKQKSCWVLDGNTWYYMDAKGVMYENNWVKYKGEEYFVKPGGEMVNGWYPISGKWYYFDSSGKKLKNQWILTNWKWYYLGEKGDMIDNKWLEYHGNHYYLLPGGEMATGEHYIDGSRYVFYAGDVGDPNIGILLQ